MLPLRARVDLGAMAMRGTPHAPKLQHCWNLTIRLFSVISRTLVSCWGLTLLQRCSQCILHPQPTGQSTWYWTWCPELLVNTNHYANIVILLVFILHRTKIMKLVLLKDVRLVFFGGDKGAVNNREDARYFLNLNIFWILWVILNTRRPARTYIQQLCEDTGCCPEDLPRAMNDREEWRERVRDIRATSATWWWWWWWYWIQLINYTIEWFSKLSEYYKLYNCMRD